MSLLAFGARSRFWASLPALGPRSRLWATRSRLLALAPGFGPSLPALGPSLPALGPRSRLWAPRSRLWDLDPGFRGCFGCPATAIPVSPQHIHKTDETHLLFCFFSFLCVFMILWFSQGLVNVFQPTRCALDFPYLFCPLCYQQLKLAGVITHMLVLVAL